MWALQIDKIKSKFSNNFFYQNITCLILGSLSSFSFSGNTIYLPLIFLAINIFFYFTSLSFCNLYNSFKLSFAYSFGQLFFGIYWISIAFETGKMAGIYIGLLAVLLLCVFLAFFMAFSITLAKYLSTKWNLNSMGYAIIFSVFYSLSEYIRGNIFGGFPWNTIGYIWSDSYILLQPVALLGIYGFGLLSILAILSFSLFFKNKLYAFYALLPLIILFSYSIIKYEHNYLDEEKIALRLVQPNIKQEEKWESNLKEKHFKKLVNLSTYYKNSFKPKYIVWPESAFEFNSKIIQQKNIHLFDWLEQDQLLITGVTREDTNSKIQSEIYNSAFIINNKAEVINHYDKVKLVPFGEFIPLRKYFSFEKFTIGSIDFSPGLKSNIIEIEKNSIKIGMLICYEIIFPGKVINGARPDFLINITNDAWYRDSIGPVQHLSAARVRAIEEGITIIRVANTGISTVIDPAGKYLNKLLLEEEGIIDITSIKKSDQTLFSIYGNFIYIILCIFMLLLSRFVFKNVNYNFKET